MPDKFNLSFPLTAGGVFNREIGLGEIIFILGANGTGKSSLVSRFFRDHSQHARRISAHRQTWFASNTLDMTSQSRDSMEQNIRSRDQQAQARYRHDYAAERTSVAIYDLIDSDTMLERSIAKLVRAGNLAGAEEKAKTPAAIQIINELMRLSNIPIEISLEERQKIVARRNGGESYSVAELSDGERNAFLIAADVLTAAPESLVLIDEPERHLHRAVISPLLTLLFQKRHDCAFIISTHEVMLPIDNINAHTILVRSCVYSGSHPQSWSADMLEPNASVDEELKRDILGARQKILFLEGTPQSLDAPLYSVIFPGISVISKASCRDVEHAVRGLREAKEMHWVHAWGVVDNDRRAPEDIARLRSLGVHAVSHFSVEAIYFHPEMIRRVAVRQAAVTGEDAQETSSRAVANAIEGVAMNREHLVKDAVERLVWRRILGELPSKDDIRIKPCIEIRVDVVALRTAEEALIEQMIAAKNFEGLLQHYPVRESVAIRRIVTALGLSRDKYEAAIRKLLQEDQDALKFVRSLFGTLCKEMAE
jgi:ABC-type cobalamin/Fe3+-siderophores transport system ATPase subunit